MSSLSSTTNTFTTLTGLLTQGNPTCPGSPSWKHAKCSMITTFPKSTTCDAVQTEILARMNGENGWVDPHNSGSYTILNTAVNSEEKTSQISGSRMTANGQYTDMFIFTLQEMDSNDDENVGCVLSGCSESQVFSILDFSTNYCNLRNLYCNKSDGCPIVEHDFDYDEKYVGCWQRDASKCIGSGSGNGDGVTSAE